MRIKNNISALNAQIALRINESKLTKDLEKLTSGYRINRSGDDAAGLAISEQMRSQIAGLTQGELNARDGIGLLRTGEGAMQEIHAMLIRMNGLAIRSANGVYTDEDHRELIQEEVDRISEEIDRIASATRFNYVNLFHDDKSMAADSGLTPPVGLSADETDTAQIQTLGLGGASEEKAVAAANDLPGVNTSKEIKFEGTNYAEQAAYIDPVKVAMAGSDKAKALQQERLEAVAASIPGTSAETKAVQQAQPELSTAPLPGATKMARALSGKSGTASQTTEASKIVFQIGPDAEHTISIPRFYLSKEALGLDKFDVSTQEAAKESIDKVNDMINYVSQIRGAYGAVDNALEHAMNSMNVYKENLTAAESRIRDTDMAKELTERTKDNILAQTAQAMLAQANALPETTLSLLQ